MNLIITPVYKSFPIVKRMCEAIDKNSRMEFVHILVDDDSGKRIPIKPSQNRRIIEVRRDVPDVIHKNGGANAIQLGYDFAHHPFINENPNPEFENIFVIESDVIVEPDWDVKQVELLKIISKDWGTLDIQSIDEEGKVTYPCTVSPRHDEYSNENFEWIYYPDWQCTLFNPELFKAGFKFNNAPSHFDVMFGRKMEERGYKAYRAKGIRALHVNGGGNSRQYLK